MMEDKFKLQTKLGILEVSAETNSEYPGILIKLNGIPVTFIEQTVENEEYKLIQKNYPNKHIHKPIDGVNYAKYQIDVKDEFKEKHKNLFKYNKLK